MDGFVDMNIILKSDEKKKNSSIMNRILLGCVLLQFATIMYFNYVHVYSLLDIDTAMGIRQNIEQWKHGIFLKDFVFATTLSVDYTCFFFMPIYLLTDNLGLAMTLGQMVSYGIIVALLWDIFLYLKATKEQFLLAVFLVFTPYSLDVLDYAYLLFISVGYWTYRVIAMLLLFDLLLMCKQSRISRWKFGVICAANGFVLFWTSLSTGNYILCMVVLPFILYEIWNILDRQMLFWKIKESWIMLLSVTSCMLGWIYRNANVLEMGRDHNNLDLLTAERIFDNMKNAIAGAFMLLGGLTNLEGVSVFSWFGLLVMLKLGFTCLSIIFVVRECIRRKGCGELTRMFICIFLVNMGVLLITNTSYSEKMFECRYHMLWCVAFLIFDALVVGKPTFRNPWINRVITWGIVAVVAVINVGGFYYLKCQLDEKNYEEKILALAETSEVDTIFVYDKPSIAYHLRAMDLEKTCVGVTYEKGYIAITSWGYYQACTENASSDSPNILICSETAFAGLPSYVRNTYRLVDENTLGEDRNVYYGEHSPWDYGYGFPLASEERSVDFPYTKGYTCSGIIDDNGCLITDRADHGVVMASPNSKVLPGNYRVTVVYDVLEEAEDTAVSLELTAHNGKTILLSGQMPIDQNSYTLEGIRIESEFELQVQIVKSADCKILVEKLVFERIPN